MTMIKRLTIFTIFRRTELDRIGSIDQFSLRVLQLLAALPRGIDRKEPHPTHKRYSKNCGNCHKCHPEAGEWPIFVPEAMPTMRALTPQSAQRISLSGSIPKPCDRLLIVVSKFPLSFSSHVEEPFSAHSGHVTDITNRSRLCTTSSWMERRLTNNGQNRPSFHRNVVGVLETPSL
jgi:hypothetical protein